LHIKTAGTTWLEELIGLAEAGGDALALAKEIYSDALEHRAELCAPYATVIDIDPKKLPGREEVAGWTSSSLSARCGTIRNARSSIRISGNCCTSASRSPPRMGDRYLTMLEACEATVSKNVTENLYERHLKPLFLDK
jgi:tagaturonate epimerase